MFLEISKIALSIQSSVEKKTTQGIGHNRKPHKSSLNIILEKMNNPGNMHFFLFLFALGLWSEKTVFAFAPVNFVKPGINFDVNSYGFHREDDRIPRRPVSVRYRNGGPDEYQSTGRYSSDAKTQIVYQKIVKHTAAMPDDVSLIGYVAKYLESDFKLPKHLPMEYEAYPCTEQENRCILAWDSPLSPAHDKTRMEVAVIGSFTDDKKSVMVVVRKVVKQYSKLPPLMKNMFVESEKQILKALESGLDDFMSGTVKFNFFDNAHQQSSWSNSINDPMNGKVANEKLNQDRQRTRPEDVVCNKFNIDNIEVELVDKIPCQEQPKTRAEDVVFDTFARIEKQTSSEDEKTDNPVASDSHNDQGTHKTEAEAKTVKVESMPREPTNTPPSQIFDHTASHAERLKKFHKKFTQPSEPAADKTNVQADVIDVDTEDATEKSRAYHSATQAQDKSEPAIAEAIPVDLDSAPSNSEDIAVSESGNSKTNAAAPTLDVDFDPAEWLWYSPSTIQVKINPLGTAQAPAKVQCDDFVAQACNEETEESEFHIEDERGFPVRSISKTTTETESMEGEFRLFAFIPESKKRQELEDGMPFWLESEEEIYHIPPMIFGKFVTVSGNLGSVPKGWATASATVHEEKVLNAAGV